MDQSRYSKTAAGGLVLVPAWDQAAIAELGERAVPIIIDGDALPDDYGAVKPYTRPDIFPAPEA